MSRTPPKVYRDAILTRLLIDLFMSKKEQPQYAENHAGSIRRFIVETTSIENRQESSDLCEAIPNVYKGRGER